MLYIFVCNHYPEYFFLPPNFLGIIMLITRKDILRMCCIPLFGAHKGSIFLHHVNLLYIYIYLSYIFIESRL